MDHDVPPEIGSSETTQHVILDCFTRVYNMKSNTIFSAAILLLFNVEVHAQRHHPQEGARTASTSITEDRCETATATADIVACADAETAAWDRRLNAAYRELRGTLDDPLSSELQNVQRKWIAYRDARCSFTTETGTLRLIIKASCITSMTKERALELEKLISENADTGSPSSGDATSTLSIWNEPDLAAIEGWWGMSPEGCNDIEDNQYRVAIGRFDVQRNDSSPTVVTFGRGQAAIGMRDGGCDLGKSLSAGNGKYTFEATCEFEGERSNGPVIIFRSSKFTINISIPDRINNHWNLDLIECQNNVEIK